jgi:hypothetical protein
MIFFANFWFIFYNGKNEVFSKFKLLKILVEVECNIKIEYLFIDHGRNM